MSKPKIMVFRMRELIYTAIFAILAIILLILVFFMFRPKKESASTQTSSVQEKTDSKYCAGIYTTSLAFSDHAVDVEVTVNQDKIKGIRLINLKESVATMFPLVEPALDELAEQICQNQSTDGITCSQENKYTSQILFQAIQNALSKARG